MERIHRIVFVVVLVMATLAGSATAVKADGTDFEFNIQNTIGGYVVALSVQIIDIAWDEWEDDLEFQSNAPIGSTQPTLTINYPRCIHEQSPIICPPGVVFGSTSLYYSNGLAAFPAIGGGIMLVDPSKIKPFTVQWLGRLGIWQTGDLPMTTNNQIASPQTIYNKVTFRNVLFYNTGKTQKVTISDLSFDDNALFKKYPGTNPSIWLTASVSSTTGLTVNNPQFPYAVLTNYTPACDESFVSITPGYPTYIRARNIAFNGNLYEVDMPVLTLPDGSLGFSVLAVRQGSNCPNTGNSLSQDFVLTLSKVNVNGTDYWAQLQWTGSAFKLLSYH